MAVIRTLIISFLCLAPGVAGALPLEPQNSPEVDPPKEESAASEDEEKLELFPDEAPEVSDAELRAQGEDPCALNEEGNWVDWLNRKVTSSVCGSARWFDSFFGTQNEFDNRQSTFGRMGVGAFWDEDDGFDPEFSLRAKWNFPNMENRFNAVVGRGDVEDILEGGESTSPADDFFDAESEWLVGFDYHLELGARSRLSPSVGTSWSSGLDPYVRLRYVFQTSTSERGQFRIRVIPQWQKSKGYGYTIRPSYDHTLGEKFMLRLDGSMRDFEEKIGGFAYGAYVNLFHKLSPKNAMRYKIGVFSHSKLRFQPQDVGGAISWRIAVYKEILTIESLVGTTFRHRPEELSREPKLILGLVFEIKFGR